MKMDRFYSSSIVYSSLDLTKLQNQDNCKMMNSPNLLKTLQTPYQSLLMTIMAKKFFSQTTQRVKKAKFCRNCKNLKSKQAGRQKLSILSPSISLWTLRMQILFHSIQMNLIALSSILSSLKHFRLMMEDSQRQIALKQKCQSQLYRHQLSWMLKQSKSFRLHLKRQSSQ